MPDKPVTLWADIYLILSPRPQKSHNVGWPYLIKRLTKVAMLHAMPVSGMSNQTNLPELKIFSSSNSMFVEHEKTFPSA